LTVLLFTKQLASILNVQKFKHKSKLSNTIFLMHTFDDNMFQKFFLHTNFTNKFKNE